MSNTHSPSLIYWIYICSIENVNCVSQIRARRRKYTKCLITIPQIHNRFREKHETHFTRLRCCFVADFRFVLVLSGTITAADECCDSTEIASISIVRWNDMRTWFSFFLFLCVCLRAILFLSLLPHVTVAQLSTSLPDWGGMFQQRFGLNTTHIESWVKRTVCVCFHQTQRVCVCDVPVYAEDASRTFSFSDKHNGVWNWA